MGKDGEKERSRRLKALRRNSVYFGDFFLFIMRDLHAGSDSVFIYSFIYFFFPAGQTVSWHPGCALCHYFWCFPIKLESYLEFFV